MSVLFVNACVREDSRTLALAESVLGRMSSGTEVQRVNLAEEKLLPLNGERLAERDALIAAGELNHPMFRYAEQFASAGKIVIAAPFWDLAFPALLKIYLEAVTVSGITFRYTAEGRPQGLCRADELIYATTSGGPIMADFGYSYVKALAQTFYGIPETISFRVEMTDVQGISAKDIPEHVKITEIR